VDPDVLSSADLDDLIRHAANSGESKVGGNSTVTRVNFHGMDYALKDYSGRADGLQRQQQETAALTLLHRHLGQYFAEFVGVSPEGLHAAHSWLPGARPATSRLTVRSMVELFGELHALSGHVSYVDARLATDHVMTIQQLHKQLDVRISRLLTGPTAVQRVTQSCLVPELQCLMEAVPPRSAPVVTLSPSDFGVHNLLWEQASGRMFCVDLEFFGWDDAHKLVCDSLLHPLAEWTSDTASLFLESTAELYLLDEGRLCFLWPRLNLKWAAITLSRASREFSQDALEASEQSIHRAEEFIRRAANSVSDVDAMVTQVVSQCQGESR
jgi:hypothetical protein